jgi:hypothetical protein
MALKRIFTKPTFSLSALNKMPNTITERRTDLPHVSRLFLTLRPRSRGISDVLLKVFICNHTITSANTQICNHTNSHCNHTHSHRNHICNHTHSHRNHTYQQSHTLTSQSHTSAITHSHLQSHTHICNHIHQQSHTFASQSHIHICNHTHSNLHSHTHIYNHTHLQSHTHTCNHTYTHTHIAITPEQPGCYFSPKLTRHVPQTRPCV